MKFYSPGTARSSSYGALCNLNHSFILHATVIRNYFNDNVVIDTAYLKSLKTHKKLKN